MGTVLRRKSSPRPTRRKTRKCAKCGLVFLASGEFKGREQKYCSKECWSIRGLKINYCLLCKNEIRTFQSQDKKYCNQQCRDLDYRERLKGEKSHFWKGGKTAKMQLIKTSSRYRNWRKAVFERDKYTCKICGATKVYLEADHIKAKSRYPELMFDIENGRALCKPCHRKTDTFGNKSKVIIKQKKYNKKINYGRIHSNSSRVLPCFGESEV